MNLNDDYIIMKNDGDYLSYYSTTRDICFFWKGEYCADFNKKEKSIFWIWKEEMIKEKVLNKLKELGYEQVEESGKDLH